jgi:putative ABC transport system permease protein
MSCIAAGICAILIIGGYYEYNYYGLRESLIRSHYAHVQLYKKGYLGNEETDPFSYLIENKDEIVAFLMKDPRVVIATPRISVWGILNKQTGASAVVQIRGIVPENEQLINLFITKRIGSELKKNSTDTMEVGLTLAEDLNLKLNEAVFLTTITADGAQNAWQLKIGGIIGSYSSELDSVLVKIPLNIAQELITVNGVQEIIVLLEKTDMTKTYIEDLEKGIAAKGWDLDITSWYDLSGYYRQVVEYYGGYFRIIIFITCIIAFFTTLNTVMMTVFEKITEIGTLRSFGLTKLKISGILFCEALMLGVLGGAGGILISYIIAFIINKSGGIYVAPPPGVASGFYAEIMIVPVNIVICAIIAFSVPMLATVFPALKANRMQIIEQLSYNETR